MYARKNIILLGDKNTGKTSLLLRYIDKDFKDSYLPTYDANYRIKTFAEHIELTIVDTPGALAYRSVINPYIKNSAAIILVYDLTNKGSFQAIISYYLETIKENAPENIPIFLIGMKADLSNKIEVSAEEVNALVTECNSKGFNIQGDWAISAKDEKDSEKISSIFNKIKFYKEEPKILDNLLEISDEEKDFDKTWLRQFAINLIATSINNNNPIPKGISTIYTLLSEPEPSQIDYKKLKQDIFSILREREEISSYFRTSETQNFYTSYANQIIVNTFQENIEDYLEDFLRQTKPAHYGALFSKKQDDQDKAKWYKDLIASIPNDETDKKLIGTIYYSIMVDSLVLQNFLAKKMDLPHDRVTTALQAQIPTEKIDVATKYLLEAADKRNQKPADVITDLKKIFTAETKSFWRSFLPF